MRKIKKGKSAALISALTAILLCLTVSSYADCCLSIKHTDKSRDNDSGCK